MLRLLTVSTRDTLVTLPCWWFPNSFLENLKLVTKASLQIKKKSRELVLQTAIKIETKSRQFSWIYLSSWGRCQISLLRSRVSGCHATLPWNVTRRFCGTEGAADYQTGHPSRAESVWLEAVVSLIWQKLCVPFANWPINRSVKWKGRRAHYEFILTASSREGKSCCQNRWSGRWNRWIKISASKIEGQSWSGGERTFSNLKLEISLKLTPSLAFQTVFNHSAICKCL